MCFNYVHCTTLTEDDESEGIWNKVVLPVLKHNPTLSGGSGGGYKALSQATLSSNRDSISAYSK
jgi:hypothetical protein